MSTSIRYFILLATVIALAGCEKEPELTAKELMARAQQFMSVADAPSAIIELKNILQIDPSANDARWLLSENYLTLREGAFAQAQIEKLKEAGFQHPDIDAAFFRALLLQGEYKRVRDESVGNEHPGVLTARGEANLAVSDFQTGRDAQKYQQAYINIGVQQFEKALSQDPSHYDAHLGLARVAIWKKHFEDAESILARAESIAPSKVGVWILRGIIGQLNADPVRAEIAYRKALELSPHDVLVQASLARVMVAQGSTEDALSMTRRLYREHPKLPAASYLLAYSLIQNEKPDQALGILQKLVNANPGYLDGSLLLGRTLMLLKQYEQAVDAIRGILVKNPDHVGARRLLAEIELKRGRTDKAMASLRSMPRDDYESLELLGRAHIGLGETERGKWFLQRASKLAAQKAMERGTAPTSLWANFIQQQINDEAYETAVIQAERLIEAHPGEAGAHHSAGSAYLAAGDSEAARQSFHRALLLDAEDVPSLMALAKLDAQEGNLEVAALFYERALEVDRGNVDAIVNLARIETKLGETSSARSRLTEVVRRDNENASALVALANIARKEGDAVKAIEYLNKASNVAPEQAEPWYFLAKYQFDRGDLDGALAATNDVLEIDSTHSGALVLLAKIQFRQGKPQESVTTARLLASTQPTSPNAQRVLGIAHFRNDDVAKARAALSKALDLEPDHIGAMATLAAIELRAGNYSEVQRIATRLIDLEPGSATGHKLLGDMLLVQDDLDGAEQHYEITAEDPKGSEFTVGNYFALAAAYQRAGRLRDAIRMYEATAAIQPNNALALNNLAWLLHATGQDSALVIAERAYAMRPENASFADTLGWILIEQNADESTLLRAIELLRTSVSRAPDDPTIRYHLAVGLARIGRPLEAGAELTAALDKTIFPERDSAERLLQTLREQ